MPAVPFEPPETVLSTDVASNPKATLKVATSGGRIKKSWPEMISDQDFLVEAMGIEPTNLLHAMQICACPVRFFWFACDLLRWVLWTRRTLALQGVCRSTSAAMSSKFYCPTSCKPIRHRGVTATLLATSIPLALPQGGVFGTWPCYPESPSGTLTTGGRPLSILATTTLSEVL